ncbi:MAG: hypothetical protein EA370_01975 [Wenzhouxiangella sp.]|nr:MAG: hypothetical protein EA370_01975 [Wenzhouxiangella sp.]
MVPNQATDSSGERIMMTLRTCIVAVSIALASSAFASEWTGTESDDWFDPDNWSGAVPTASTFQVRINTNDPRSPEIDGQAAATGSNFGVGHNSIGELSIINAGTLTSVSAILGHQSNGNGSVTISGAGSGWQIASGLEIGRSGIGHLEIVDGGLLNTTFSSVSRLGQQATGSGSVTVTGAGALWELQGHFQVGSTGSGEMTISDGGQVLYSGNARVAQAGNSTGELTIAGTGSLLSGNRLHVGNGSTSGTTMATGVLQLLDGGTLELIGSGSNGSGNGLLIIAWNSRSEGTVVFGGPAGQSPAAPGQLLIESGLHFSNGTGTLVINHTGLLEMDFPVTGPVNGTGHIQAENGTSLFVGGDFDYSGSLAIDAGATFGAAGTLGDVDNEGTLVASPGKSATLTIDGDYSHGDNAVLEIQFAPGPVVDLVEVTGEVTISGGSVGFSFLPGDYGSEPIDELYPVLTAAGGITGTFGALDTSNPAAFQLIHDGDTVYLQVFDRLFQDRYQP